MHANRSDRQKEPPVVRLYRAALICFPERYRREYADELLYAVRMAATEAEAQGRLALVRLAWRELRDLPLAIARAHLHERSVPMNLQPGAHLPGGPIRRWQLVAVFLPFLLPLLYPQRVFTLANAISLRIGSWLFAALGLTLLGVLIVILVTGLVRKFPVWALPALGMGLFFVSALLQLAAQSVVFIAVMYPLFGGWPRGFGLAEDIWMMLLVQLVSLVIMAGGVAGLLRIVPVFHTQVRQEWTLLSFLLYGIAILPVLGNDEFHGVGGYETASLLILAMGAGLYLIAPRRWQRVLALVGPAVLSPAVMSLGLYQTFPAQSWANPADVSFRLWEALQPVLYLSPLPILLLLAALAPRLPGRGGQEPAPSPASPAPIQGSE
jgi:hypothetical protein